MNAEETLSELANWNEVWKYHGIYPLMKHHVTAGHCSGILTEFPKNVGVLSDVFTPEEHRRHGHATQPMQAVLDIAQRRELCRIELAARIVGSDMPLDALVSFYQRFGFKRQPAVLMTRILNNEEEETDDI